MSQNSAVECKNKNILRTDAHIINPPDEVELLDYRGDDVAPLDHRADAHIAACETLRDGTNDVIADHVTYRPYVLRRQRVPARGGGRGWGFGRRRGGGQRAPRRCLFFFFLVSQSA